MRNTTKDNWDAMHHKYHGSSKVKRTHLQSLRREFEVLGMRETEIVDEYFARTLVKKEMVRGLPRLVNIEESCIDCFIGKKHKDPILIQPTWRASANLELLHCDICGLIKPESSGGNKYVITFKDDFSRKTG